MKPNDTILIDGNEAPWLTKIEASKRLGVSERTIENYIAQNHLSTRPEQRRGKRPITLIDPDDVARLRAEQNRGAIIHGPNDPSHFLAEPAREIATSISAIGPALPQLVTAIAQNLVQRAPKPFLTLAEASAFTGLPAGLLRRFIRRGELPCVRYGRDVYVKTRDLDELQLELATPERDSEDRADSATAFAGGSE
jgi:excisionase family DNA binding protein